MVTGAIATDVRRVVSSVVDPEIPVLTIEDLGILRSVDQAGNTVIVTITPTYSGCPAMRQIEDDIASALRREGIDDFEIEVSHSPAWTTEWISEEGHRKLADFGIAPPTGESEVLCPKCRVDHPRMVARFGSTACKALMVCSACGEPFDYFKQF
ncbi:MAG TPA: 1,2-phenylacetyl-CoA epoxidase subunit PaaD [Acidimicrobiia bacterium]|jgi:ring-1,2-phenylacetyl-CoA epoxidase subunit PaaD|nr:1,2-phenylacetyl-CoA epoxidase subunit PaaD [Acidimicrobiia bacterium]